MSPRTGRPPKENPKDIRIQIRVDRETLEKLDECAERGQTTRSDVVRQGIDLVYAKQKNKR